MKRTAFIFSSSNLFSVYSHSVLKRYYNCEILNLRYDAEEMTESEHVLHQVENIINHHFYMQGLALPEGGFAFGEHLVSRINRLFKLCSPSIIFFEMNEGSDAEWRALKYIHECYQTPLAVFVPYGGDEDKETVYRLLKFGVREIFSNYNKDAFETIAKRNLKTC